ncbi:unnamed protein product [Peronospora belbahrii]|uniref:Uncharacterized protein n=1 Tax=Peronospora belbahrii TaxID=622444 RepID=A0AAU9L2Q7_9STRA|nr:unnamed protein product [Peronospora belbahrii]CAH0521103.1 unnamed protein product [Peronospora belbahrii]
MVTCSVVKTCLAEGSTLCNPTSQKCPPCVYALAGGDYSCYTRDKKGDCPFAETFAECDKSTSTSNKSASDSNSDKTPEETKDKSKEVSVTTDSVTAPEMPTSDTDSTIDEARSNDINSDTTSSLPTATSPTLDDSKPTQPPIKPPSDVSESSSVPIPIANTDDTSSSLSTTNLALIIAAVVLALILIAFIARRMTKKKKMAHKLENTASTQGSQRSNRTHTSGVSSENIYSTYGYTSGATKDNGITMLSDSQASSTYGPDYNDQLSHIGASPRSMADFSNYDGDSLYSEDSQYFSVSTGPQNLYANNKLPLPLTKAGQSFVDVTAPLRNNRPLELDSMHTELPLTVSQLMPTAVGGKCRNKAYAVRQKPGSIQYGHVQPTAYDSAMPQSHRQPQIFGLSTASSMRSDYDIVDPLTMRDAEARNTEILAEENFFPKFSFESEADMDDESSSDGENSGDERVQGMAEHMI